MLREEDKALHEKAVRCANAILKNEAELVEIIQQVDETKLFRRLEHASLFDYVVNGLHISPGSAYGYIAVARKAKTVPELKQAIDQGELNVNVARKIVSVITPQNSKDWIEKASQGKRCEQLRWVEFHHQLPVSQGGTNSLENLTTLCHHHHRVLHEPLSFGLPKPEARQLKT